MALLVASCGGSKSTPTRSTPIAPPAQSTATTAPSQRTATTTIATAKTTTATAKTTATTVKTTATTGAVTARVPARFTITAAGTVNPPTITVPAHFAVELIVVSDGGAHQITLRTPQPASLTVRAHGQASTLINSLRAGRYPLQVDGAPKGALVIGGSPGP